MYLFGEMGNTYTISSVIPILIYIYIYLIYLFLTLASGSRSKGLKQGPLDNVIELGINMLLKLFKVMNYIKQYWPYLNKQETLMYNFFYFF